MSTEHPTEGLAGPTGIPAAVLAVAADAHRHVAPTPGPARPTTTDERRAALEQIASEVRVCTRCRLAAARTNAVPGEGHPDTEVIFVGEGPGFNEDQQGRPFVGAAGRFLTELITSVGWRREEVYITNVVKCRPPDNRDPEPDEIAACAPYLRRQLEVLEPALVVTLGRFSMQSFLPGSRIGEAHGTVRPVDPDTGAATAKVLAMYHPAAAFRQQTLKETIQIDMTRVPQALIDARESRAAARDAKADAGPASQPQAAEEVQEAAMEAAALTSVLDPTGAMPVPDDVPATDDDRRGLLF